MLGKTRLSLRLVPSSRERRRHFSGPKARLPVTSAFRLTPDGLRLRFFGSPDRGWPYSLLRIRALNELSQAAFSAPNYLLALS